jgi:hypothetical protein
VAERQVGAEFVFDRAGEQALAHAYRVLVPERRGRTVQRRDSDDPSQVLTVAKNLEPVSDHDREGRPAIGA